MNMEFKTVHKEEGYGAVDFGIEIKIASRETTDLKQHSIQNAIYKAVREIKAEVCASIKADDPKTAEQTKENREIINLFPAPIFVEEIPNGYCGDWCCRHLPWFVVTTSIGRITIGWRKRVISIDWSETVGTGFARSLFENEDVTKGEKYIHAWGTEKAKEYIDRIIESTKS